jgi:hypothetical protein
MRVNCTTYDVQWGEDVIHARTSPCDIMMLNPAFAEDPSQHPFCYAWVLGIFHTNVIYLGGKNQDYRPWQLEFLWVRWLHVEGNIQSGWKALKLDHVQFPPMTGNADAFGFVDPVDVLQGCHTIPTFSRGQVHPDGNLFSNLAQDQNDWFVYYINRCVAPIEFFPALSSFRLRFVDHNMVLHYDWGHGMGHTYAFGANWDVADAPLLHETRNKKMTPAARKLHLKMRMVY